MKWVYMEEEIHRAELKNLSEYIILVKYKSHQIIHICGEKEGEKLSMLDSLRHQEIRR